MIYIQQDRTLNRQIKCVFQLDKSEMILNNNYTKYENSQYFNSSDTDIKRQAVLLTKLKFTLNNKP